MKDPFSLSVDLAQRLEALESESLRRSLRDLSSAQGVVIEWQGQTLLNFSSNDYLGLAAEPQLAEAGRRALGKYGSGAGASRLVCGSLPPHVELESALAEWKGTEGAIAFSSGYAAAVGSIPALVGPGDVVILDKLCHASLIDGARLSGAQLRVFPHNGLERLQTQLAWARKKFPRARVLVVTESVFSMDGDRAPLADLVALKERFGAWLMVDEAHATGLFGEGGRGLVEAAGLRERVDIQMGTLSKALGGSGGFICGLKVLVDWLANRARSFVFSTAPSPVAAAMAVEAVHWIQGEEARGRRRQLRRNVETLTRCAPGCFPEPMSAILPMQLGEEAVALEVAGRLLEAGFWVPAIRYPTVARGAARLRVALSALHSEAMVEGLGRALVQLAARKRV